MVTNMTHWHEHPVKSGGWVFRSPQPSRVTPVFRGQDVRKAPFEGYFMRYEGETLLPNGRPPNWHKHPDGWFELRPHELLLAWSSQEAKEKFTPLLPLVEDGKHDNLFDRRPYEPPVRAALVRELEHPTRVAKARIGLYPDGRYRILYAVYAPNGRYMPLVTPSVSAELDWEWGSMSPTDDAGRELTTYADDLESAMEIATRELDQLVAADPEIKMR
jgi:hypothetical protein